MDQEEKQGLSTPTPQEEESLVQDRMRRVLGTARPTDSGLTSRAPSKYLSSCQGFSAGIWGWGWDPEDAHHGAKNVSDSVQSQAHQNQRCFQDKVGVKT